MAPTLSRHAPAPTTDAQWLAMAKGMLKGELKRQNLTYEELAKRMAAMGLHETETTIRNKASRGTFSFVFALQAMRAIGVELIPFKPTLTATLDLPPELIGHPATEKGGQRGG